MKCSIWDEKGSDCDTNKDQKLEEPKPVDKKKTWSIHVNSVDLKVILHPKIIMCSPSSCTNCV